jgi:hypothetical protein
MLQELGKIFVQNRLASGKAGHTIAFGIGVREQVLEDGRIELIAALRTG